MINLRIAAPLVCGLIWGGLVSAQPSGARGENFVYKVLAGDTLLDISQTYTRQGRNWSEIQRLNAVADPYRLPIGKELHIPFRMIPEVDAPARITHQTGQILVNGTFTFALMVGLSVGDTTLGTLVANLGYDKLVMPRPVFIGDTLRATSEVAALKPSKSRPDAGIVTFLHECLNQRDEVVCRCERAALLKRRG